MARKRAATDPNQPSLFPELDQDDNLGSVQTVLPQPSAIVPEWQFPLLPHLDVIGDETVVVYTFDIDALSHVAGDYSEPVIRVLLRSLRELGASKSKKLRSNAFTVFVGDIIGYDLFAVALSTKSPELVNFLTPYFSQVTGYRTLEASSSRQFLPKFRYDHGYIVEYSDEGLEGTKYFDNDDFYGSEQVIYRRIWMPPDAVGRRRSAYGKLR